MRSVTLVGVEFARERAELRSRVASRCSLSCAWPTSSAPSQRSATHREQQRILDAVLTELLGSLRDAPPDTDHLAESGQDPDAQRDREPDAEDANEPREPQRGELG
jgi:hypothetical protein